MRFLRSTGFLIVVIVAVAAAIVATRWLFRPRPTPFVRVLGTPVDAREVSGVWYWIERPNKQPQRLVRADSHGSAAVGSDDEIAGFDVEGKQIAWSSRHGKEWHVMLAGARSEEYRSTTKVGRPCLWKGRLYWAEDVPARIDPSIALPSLGPTARVYVADPGAKPSAVADIPATGVSVIGHDAQELYVAGQQGTDQAAMTIYRVRTDGSLPVRVAAETEVMPAVVGQDGTLYWIAPSRDSSERGNTCCVRRIRPGGTPETLSDWLPGPGAIYLENGTVWYVNRTVEETAWLPGEGNALPKQAPIPAGYGVVGVGQNSILLDSRLVGPDPNRLYLLPLP